MTTGSQGADLMNVDQFENTAAWLEYCDGMTRFAAEAEAARRQGLKRYEALNEISKRNSERGGDHGSSPARDAADNLPGVQPVPKEEKGPVPVGHVQAGWCGVVLLALLEFGGRMV